MVAAYPKNEGLFSGVSFLMIEGNMNKTAISILFVTILVWTISFAQDQNEMEKINFLIDSVENAKGVTFIRNRTEYDAKAAADHLRLKLRESRYRVKTAEDFIKYCASKSSMSGEPYRIKFSDGTITDSESYFRKQLLRFEKVKK
jgi:hypothetical protein